MNPEQLERLKQTYKTLKDLQPKGQIGKAYQTVMADIAILILSETIQ